ncbi:unnamed protein product, partial [Laminaria digitata]
VGGDGSTLASFMHYHQPRFAGVSGIVGSSSGDGMGGGRMAGDDAIRFPFPEPPGFAHTPGPVVLHDPAGLMPSGVSLHHGIGAQGFGVGATSPLPLPPPPAKSPATGAAAAAAPAAVSVGGGGTPGDVRGEGGLASSSPGAGTPSPSRRADRENRDASSASKAPNSGDERGKGEGGGP